MKVSELKKIIEEWMVDYGGDYDVSVICQDKDQLPLLEFTGNYYTEYGEYGDEKFGCHPELWLHVIVDDDDIVVARKDTVKITKITLEKDLLTK
jgi:hypothetical protein